MRAIRDLAAWREARLVCAFLPLRSEPQIQPLWQTESGPEFCFPRIRSDGLELLLIEDRALLTAADWKLETPEFAACPIVSLAKVDLIFVPGLAFTRDGRRLGRGGGYYDRLLADCPRRTVRVGVCFECQIVEDLPSELHDQHVQGLATEGS